MQMPAKLVAIGRLLRPHGVRGELVLEPFGDFPEWLAEVETVYLGEPPQPHRLAGTRLHRRQWLLQLADCADRNAAEAYQGQLVQIAADYIPPLPPGHYYHHQIIGLTAVTEEGEVLGPVSEVLQTGANDVYVVAGAAGEILLPAIQSVVRTIDLENKRMTVHLLGGMR